MAAADVDNADREQAYAELMLARSARELVDNASRDRHSIDDEWHVLGEDLDDLREKLDAVAQAATAAIVAHANHKEPARTAPDQRAIDFAALIITGGGNAEWNIDGDSVVVRDDAGWVRGRFRLDVPVDEITMKQLALLAVARAAAQIARGK